MIAMKACMLTTIDNPFNPFTHWDEWFQFDLAHKYDCCGKVARASFTSDAFTDEENNEEITRACKEIAAKDPLKIYTFVFGESESNSDPETRGVALGKYDD